ncbi:MAG TPA: hypothetical protein VM364_23475 [Vicinamibacterales bacterium]|nr:hypothetical protein [Vicinamibacterales bacterium]
MPLVEGVDITPMVAAGIGLYDVGAAGTLAFQSGTPYEAANRSVVWVNRQGQEEAIGLKPRAYRGPALSPDATRIAVADVNEEADIWVWDLKRETLTRVTSGGARDSRPLWTPDGRSLIYTRDIPTTHVRRTESSRVVQAARHPQPTYTHRSSHADRLRRQEKVLSLARTAGWRSRRNCTPA